MANKQVSSEVLQELTNKVQDIINNYCWNLEHFSDDEVNSFFQASADEVTYYNSLINDKIESKNFIWSSKNISEKIAQAIIQANEYADELIKDISSIKLKYVTSLPTSDISENTIYILKASDGTSKDTLNLYNATDGWTSIGDFNISLDDYYTKTETDTKLDLKANKTEVIANDKINQTLDSATNSSDTILSTSGLQVELDKKANDDEVIKKTDITTTIDSSSTDTQVPSAKSVYDNINKDNNMKTYTSIKQLGLTAPVTVGEIYNKLPNNSCINILASQSSIIDLPLSHGLLSIRKSNEEGFDIVYKQSSGNRKAENIMYIGQLKGVDGSELSWSRLCTRDDKDIHITNDERTKWNNKVDKTDITTTIDSSSTDTQIPSAKAVYNNINKDNNIKTYTSVEQLGATASTTVGNIYNKLPDNSCINIVASKSTIKDLPTHAYRGLLSITKSNVVGFNIIFKESDINLTRNAMYIGQLKGLDGSGLSWQKVCTTSVADVPWTELTLDSGMSGTITYRIKNGICYVNVDVLKSSTMSTNNQTIVTGLPVPEVNAWYSLISSIPSQGGLLVNINSTGRMVSNVGLDNTSYFGSFSYPVAES